MFTRRILTLAATLIMALGITGTTAAAASTATVGSPRYLVELSAWIPQQWVVDPLNPAAAQPCDRDGCTQNGPQNLLLSHCSSSTLWESVFAGRRLTQAYDRRLFCAGGRRLGLLSVTGLPVSLGLGSLSSQPPAGQVGMPQVSRPYPWRSTGPN